MALISGTLAFTSGSPKDGTIHSNVVIDNGADGDEFVQAQLTVPDTYRELKLRNLSVGTSGTAATLVSHTDGHKARYVHRRGSATLYGPIWSQGTSLFGSGAAAANAEWWWEPYMFNYNPLYLPGDIILVNSPEYDTNATPTADWQITVDFDIVKF